MPDAPDFSQYALQGTKDTLHDLGELAARIEARDVWDRRGQVIWYDYFENGISPWAFGYSGTGANARIQTTACEWGGYCLRLYSGSDATLRVSASHYFSPSELNGWGFESGVHFVDTFGDMRFRMLMYDGSIEYQAAIDLDYATLKLKVLDNTLGSVDVATIGDPQHLNAVYHQVKLVADFRTLKYVRLVYDNTEYDLKAYTIAQAASADHPNKYVGWRYTGLAGSNRIALIGHAIITVGEP